MKSYIFFAFLAVALLVFYIRTSYKLHTRIRREGPTSQPSESLTQSLVRFLSVPFSTNGTETSLNKVNEPTTGSNEESLEQSKLRSVLDDFRKELLDLEGKLPKSEKDLQNLFKSSLLKQEIDFYQKEIQKFKNSFQQLKEEEETERFQLYQKVFKEREIAKEKYWNRKEEDPREGKLLQKLESYRKKYFGSANNPSTPQLLHCIISLKWDYIVQSSVSCALFGLLSDRKIVFDFTPEPRKKQERYSSFQESFSSEEELFKYFSFQLNSEKNQIYGSGHKQLSAKEIMCWPTPFQDIEDQVIEIHSDDYYGSAILANQQYQDFYDSLPPNYFQIIYDFLWKVQPSLQFQVEMFISTQFSVYVIGIELFEYRNSKTDNNFLPPPSLFSLQAEELSYYQTFVPYSQVKWYLRTNSEITAQKLKKDFPDKIFVLFDPSLTPLERELVEWISFGYTDDQIITEPSTFGDTATARKGMNPALCNFAKYCTRRIFPVPNTLSPSLDEQPLTCLKNTSYKYASSQDAGSYFWRNIFSNKPVIF